MTKTRWIIWGCLTALAIVWGTVDAVKDGSAQTTAGLVVQSLGFAAVFSAIAYWIIRPSRRKKE